MNPSKRKILEKAFSLFLVKSYNSVSMREIQELSNVSRGAIYHHFKSKEEIYEDVVNEYLLPIYLNYSLIAEGEKKTLQDAILGVIKCRQNHVNTLKEITSAKLIDFYFFKFLFQASEHSSNFNEQVGILMEKELTGWKNIIKFAMRSGELRADIDVDFVAEWIISTPFGLGITTAFSNAKFNFNDLRTTYLKLYSTIKKNSIY
ncbi:TetR/AcrR family transcriptional regulator [Viscerimonas tarda]